MVIAIIALFFMWQLLDAESQLGRKGCGISPLRLQLGSQILVLDPPDGRHFYIVGQDNNQLSFCHDIDEPPKAAKSFVRTIDGPPSEKERPFPLRVSVGLYEGTRPDLNQEMRKALEEQRKRIEDLPSEDGYYIFEYKPHRWYYYPRANINMPIVSCIKSSFSKAGLECSFLMPWRQNLDIWASFFTGDYPPAEWLSLKTFIVEYVESLVYEER